METAAKVLLGAAAVLAVAGALLLLLSKLGIDRLPGDVVLRRGDVTIYVPVGLMVVVSVAATIILNVLMRR